MAEKGTNRNFQAITSPQLLSFGQETIHSYLKKRESYLLQVKEAHDDNVKPATVLSSIDCSSSLFLLATRKCTSLPLSSLLGGEAWIVYIVNLYRRAHSKVSRDRTYTACLTARQVLADLAGMGATACSQPKPHDEVGEIHAMRLAISQRVSSSSLLHWPSPA
jgi:hypothetical protein